MGYEYLRNESIIRSKTREFFGVGTVVTASAYLVSVVDFMLIGALLGADAVAAAGLCDSFVDVAELFGFVLSSGGPVAAGILLGKRRLRQANGVFTLSLLLTLAGGLLCWCLLPFCGFFSGVLSNNGAIANDVARYAFFTLLSSPFVGVNLVLSSFAILDDRSKLAMGSVVAANGVNIVLDVVFMKYLRTGVAGAAAASLLGNAAGILVVLPYLLSKKRTFRFVLRAGDLRETGRELASSCSSFATDKASRIFSGLTVNLLLMYFVGNIGVALYAVYSQLRFILRILAGGALQTISTLGSMLYGERDFYGLRKMLSLLSKYTYALVAALMAGLFCFRAVSQLLRHRRRAGHRALAPHHAAQSAFPLAQRPARQALSQRSAAAPVRAFADAAERGAQNTASAALRGGHFAAPLAQRPHRGRLVPAGGAAVPRGHAAPGKADLWECRPPRAGGSDGPELPQLFHHRKGGKRRGHPPGD